jgi:hypothetical protein
MRSVLVLGRWFYPADTSLLIWLVGCTLLAFVALGARWVMKSLGRRIFTAVAVVLSGIGVLVCLAMIAAETVVYEFSSPLSVAGYAALLAAFAWQIRQSRSEEPHKLQGIAAFALASVAYTYLFFYVLRRDSKYR